MNEIFNFTQFSQKLNEIINKDESDCFKVTFNNNKIEVIKHTTTNYMGKPINNLMIIFTPHDIVWDYERKMWERNGKISNKGFNTLKESIEKYLKKKKVEYI